MAVKRPVLAHSLTRAHGEELIRLERRELRQLRRLYHTARLELRGRLAELAAQSRGDTFTAQHLRVSLAQVETGVRTIIERMGSDRRANISVWLERSIEQTMAEVAVFESEFLGASGPIRFDAVQRLAEPRSLLLNQYDTSVARYGSELIGDIQRRLAVHALKRSTWDAVSLDVAGRLKTSAITGARWKAERIVRTEMSRVLNAGHQVALEEAALDFPDLQRQWDATLDQRTSKICIALNGVVVALDEPWNHNGRLIAVPPALPNCRSRTLPYRAAWESMLPIAA